MLEADFDFLDLVDSVAQPGSLCIAIHGSEVLLKCHACDATFPQGVEGHRACRQHEFHEHGRATTYSLSELDGKTLRIVVVQSHKSQRWGWDTKGTDIYGIDDEHGIAYHISNTHRYEDSDRNKGSWKWKLTKQTTHDDGQKPMPNVLALLSNGSKSTDAK